MTPDSSVKDWNFRQRASSRQQQQQQQQQGLGLGAGPHYSPGNAAAGAGNAKCSSPTSLAASKARGSEEPHGTWTDAVFHIITAVVGAGVLGLPNAMAWLGLPAGLLLMLVFYLCTLWTSFILAEAKEAAGVQCSTYRQLVLVTLGPRTSLVLTACQYMQLVLVMIGYSVTAGANMRNILKQLCPQGSQCPEVQPWTCVAVFGALQLVMSQLPNLESAWWSSLIGAAMSLLYSCIALGLGLPQVGNHGASLYGRPAPPLDKMFGVFGSVGTFAFAFAFSAVLVEIQATLSQPPSSSVSMKKAITVSISISAFFYTSIAVSGYMALGDAVPGDILEGFTQPRALITLASCAVLLHMVMAYQVFAQPVFELIESSLHLRLDSPRAGGGGDAAAAKALEAGAGRPPPDCSSSTRGLDAVYLRGVLRSAVVLAASAAAAAVPYFADVISLIGALTFWLPGIHLPITMHLQSSSPPVPLHWRLFMYSLDALFLAASVMAVLASARTLWLHTQQEQEQVQIDVMAHG